MNRLLDVSGLPSYRFSHHSLMWWGVMSMIAIEGTVFAMAIGTYFYLWSQNGEWPLGVPLPNPLWGTVNLVILLASIYPNHWTKRAGEDGDNRRIGIGLAICCAFGVALIAVRVLEFPALNVAWDTNAYGSAVWMLLGLHTVHLVTDVYDSFVLGALFWSSRPNEGKRHVDVSENGLYWYFVVFTWIPIYAVIYWAPRLL